MELVKELIQEVAIEFKEHLEMAGNERILFSGKFGKGKTTFLTEFFKEQTKYCGEEQYDVVFLDPVNYSVASNEDIFRYIKYDILLHLLEKKVDLDAISFTYGEAASFYIANHPLEVIKSLVSYIPKVGMLLEEQKKGIESLHKKINTFNEEVNAKSADAVVSDFLKTIENEPYSIYENDIITGIIRQMLNPEHKQKQNVLIIDNLDRIDPEHIFRILNIFSSHMLFSQDRVKINKFFFDKVIVVCDINNIRNIYKNKYGADVDFSGYIDKFYSTSIFHIQNYSQLRKVCQKQLRTLRIRFDNSPAQTLNDLPFDFGIFHLITTLVYQNRLSLRQLLNYCTKTVTVPDVMISTREATETPLVEMLILSEMVGGYQILSDILVHLIDSKAQTSNYEDHFALLLYYDTRDIHKWTLKSESFRCIINERQCQVVFHFNNSRPSQVFIHHLDGTNQFVASLIDVRDYYRLYLKLLREFHVQKWIE